VALINGDNILGLNLKADTIENYVKAAAKLYTDRGLDNPYKPEKSKLKENFPEILIKALRKYEEKKDRKECVTDTMFEYINALAIDQHDDSLICVLRDFFIWSRYGGPRRSEWCQTTKTNYQKVPEGEIAAGEALAFTIEDITAFDKKGRHLDIKKARWNQVDTINVRWRFQKNQENGEIITYYRDYENPDWCAVKALWNIVQRAIRLDIPTDEPVAKYADRNGKTYFVTDYQVTALLRRAAKEVLKINDSNTLAKWSSHSLRVTAANLLHRMNYSEAFIKKRLRWRSDAFLGYLRNTLHVAQTHTIGLKKSIIKVTNEDRKMVPSIFRTPGENDTLWALNLA
jgi:hypothetical protein